MKIIKTLASYIKEYKRDSIISPILMIIEVIVDMIIPFLMASIIDDGVEKGDIRHICIVGVYMLIATAIGLLTGMWAGATSARASAGLAKNLREGMFTNIQTFSFSNIDRFSTASLVTRLTTDVMNIQNAYQMILRMFIRAPFQLIIAMTMSYIISPRLANIYLITILILIVLIIFIMRIAMRYFKAAFPKYDALNESIQENVSGMRVVKAYVREDHEIEKFNKASMNIYNVFKKAERSICGAPAIMNAAIFTCIILISWFGAKMIVANDLTTGQLMSLLTYCITILMSLMIMSVVLVMITMSEASAERICEVLNEKSDLTNPSDPVYEIPDGSICFDHVTFRYNKTSEEPVLSDISLSIKSGETIGIIGGTGSAKTSLINLISRLYDVEEGSVSVGGIDVRNYDMEALRNKVAVVLQKNELFSGTILDNLRWGNKDATFEECRRACRLACADEYIMEKPDGYETHIEQGGANVSGGQKQRLCIARALLKNPKVLILDDSTSAVDTATEAKIRRTFREEIPDVTKIIIAQRISSVQDADRIIVMNEGRIDAVGTHDYLVENNDIYREVYESQSGGNRDFDEAGGE